MRRRGWFWGSTRSDWLARPDLAVAMTRLFLMENSNGASRPGDHGTIRAAIPPARHPQPVSTPGRAGGNVPRRDWRARGWDIPWLGGRSTAPWVVLATVVIL